MLKKARSTREDGGRIDCCWRCGGRSSHVGRTTMKVGEFLESEVVRWVAGRREGVDRAIGRGARSSERRCDEWRRGDGRKSVWSGRVETMPRESTKLFHKSRVPRRGFADGPAECRRRWEILRRFVKLLDLRLAAIRSSLVYALHGSRSHPRTRKTALLALFHHRGQRSLEAARQVAFRRAPSRRGAVRTSSRWSSRRRTPTVDSILAR